MKLHNRAPMRVTAGLFCLVLFSAPLGVVAQAQKQAPKPKQKAEAEVEPNQTKEEVAKLARYDASGRRDPFQNLQGLRIKPTAPKIIGPPPLASRPPGLAGLLISEVSIIGMANKGDQKLVVLRGADKFTYMARENTRLYNGVLESIDGSEVTFVREVRDTAGNTITSKVVKR